MEWTSIFSGTVCANGDALWTKAADFIEGPALLRINAEGTWYYSEASGCGPNGDPASLLSRSKMLFPSGPVGALIAKIGGSSAGIDDGKVFLAGGFCVFELDKDTAGPLFLTINDEFGGMTNNRDCVAATAELRAR